jgi:hypothetical protein
MQRFWIIFGKKDYFVRGAQWKNREDEGKAKGSVFFLWLLVIGFMLLYYALWVEEFWDFLCIVQLGKVKHTWFWGLNSKEGVV